LSTEDQYALIETCVAGEALLREHGIAAGAKEMTAAG